MTNDNRELTAVDPTQVGQIYPYEIEVDYPDGAHTWEMGRMNAQAVATRFRQEAEQIELYGDLPNPVNTAIAAELERQEKVIDDELQDAEPPNFEEDNYDAGYIEGLTFAQNQLRSRIAELKAGA